MQSGDSGDDRSGIEHPDRRGLPATMLPEVLDRLPVVTYVAERARPHLLFVSAGIEQLLGYRPEEWRSDRDLRVDRTHPQDRYRVMQERAQAHAGGARFSSEYRLLTSSGRTVWVRDDAVLVGDDAGATGGSAYWWGTLVDQTQERLAEEELRTRAAQHSAVATLSQRALVIHDRLQLLTEAADLVLDTLGMGCALVLERRHEQQALTVTAAIPPDGAHVGWEADRDSMAHQALASASPVVVTDRRYAEGPARLITAEAVSAAAIAVPCPGRASAVLVVESNRPRVFTRDDLSLLQSVANVLANAVSRMSSETQLGQALKLNALGRLSAGIAHDFNNILGAILGFGSLLQPAVEDDPTAATYLAQLVAAGERAAALVEQLLTFSRERPTEAVQVDVVDVVTEMRGMLTQLLGADVDLRHERLATSAVVQIDRHQLEQVLMNLVVNARDAMPGGGTITVRTSILRSAEAEHGTVELSSQDHTVLEVEDTGTGMDAETLTQIFEPFFTTKGVGVGTGLGLSTVFGIVQRHGGTIDVDSEVGRGTRFRVYLPIDAVPRSPDAAPSQPAAGATDARPPDGQAAPRIAVVDDQEAIRTVIREMLLQNGYDVVEAGDGQACLAALGPDLDVDLLLTDVTMPGMTGPQLAEELRVRRPELPVLYMSGYAEAAVVDPSGGRRRDRMLHKPFGMRQLLDVVAEVVSGSAG